MFLKSAKGNMARKLYDIACFDADQAVQLFLKAHILKHAGYIPKTHSIRALLSHLASVPKVDKKAINKFGSEHRSDLVMLESAYLRTRYSGEEYNRQDAQKCIEVTEKVIQLVKQALDHL